MTPRTPAAAALRAIADDLMEARRYVGVHTKEAMEAVPTMVGDAIIQMGYCEELHSSDDYDRIVANLGDGVPLNIVDPLILKGYLYAAARLLQGIAARIEGEAEDAG